MDFPKIIKSKGLNGYTLKDTSNYHYDVNNDGTVDNQDLTALQDYLDKD
ncbi:MAG: dockerin type I domain-containing protein [Ruminococcus sp.]|nr:dockerin type I domain-containing protein [Ruminococcus sp.]